MKWPELSIVVHVIHGSPGTQSESPSVKPSDFIGGSASEPESSDYSDVTHPWRNSKNSVTIGMPDLRSAVYSHFSYYPELCDRLLAQIFTGWDNADYEA